MPKVIIVLLNWNGWADTLRCIQSLKQLQFDNFDIVVVDNASNDDSVERIQSAYPEIQLLVNAENGGFGHGCNMGIAVAMAAAPDFIWILNNDTTVAPDTLSALVRLIQGDDRLGAVGSVICDMESPHAVQAWGGGHVGMTVGTAHDYRYKVANSELDYLTGASMLLRRNALETAGWFDERFFMYWEDVDLSFRLREKGWRLAVADDAMVFHEASSSLGKGSPVLAKYYNESAVHFFRRHARAPALPIAIGATRRLLKGAAKGGFRLAMAIVRGTIRGFMATPQRKG